MRELAEAALKAQLMRDDLTLAVSKQEFTEASREDCMLCSGLEGGLLHPALTSVNYVDLAGFVEQHRHYREVYVELLRIPAHAEVTEDSLLFLPDDDVAFTAPLDGVYRTTVYSNDVELLWVLLGAMCEGWQVSTLAIDIDMSV